MDSQGRGWLCDWSNGEGLSRVLATDAYPEVSGFFTAGRWLNSPRTDFVSSNDPSDGNGESIGCSALFLNYLRAQLGFGWRQIVQVGARTENPSPLLANTFTLLTGRTDAFDSFYSVVTRRFPYGVQAELATDNPFPIKPDLLFYSADAGLGELYTTNGHDGLNPIVRRYTNWVWLFHSDWFDQAVGP